MFPLLPATRLIFCALARGGEVKPSISLSYSLTAPTHIGWVLHLPHWNVTGTWIIGGQEACPCPVPTKCSVILPALGRTAASMLHFKMLSGACQPWLFPHPYPGPEQGREQQHALGREGREDEAGGGSSTRRWQNRQWRTHPGRLAPPLYTCSTVQSDSMFRQLLRISRQQSQHIKPQALDPSMWHPWNCLQAKSSLLINNKIMANNDTQGIVLSTLHLLNH